MFTIGEENGRSDEGGQIQAVDFSLLTFAPEHIQDCMGWKRQPQMCCSVVASTLYSIHAKIALPHRVAAYKKKAHKHGGTLGTHC